MKLTNFTYDCGQDLYVQVLSIKGWTLFQSSVSWCEYPDWPFLQIQFGMGSLISILFKVHKFGLDIGFLERTWKL